MLEGQLRAALVSSLLSDPGNIDEVYLIAGQKSYTRKELAEELVKETEFGVELMVGILKLAIKIINKENKPKENESLFPWEPWARYEVVQPSGRVIQYDKKPTWNLDRWEVPRDVTARLKEVGQYYYMTNIEQSLIKRYDDDNN